jgi:HK97 family phage prohead protease
VNRPTAGSVEARTATVEVDAKRIRGLIPYGVESRDLGGWREVIEPGAFASTTIDDLRAVIDHAGVPLGRYPATLDVEDSADGLRWSIDPPASRADVVEAIERGDMRAGSWRMVVARDRWEGDVRHVEAIAELKDVTIVGAAEPAYGDAAVVEYRTTTGGERRQEGAEMDPQETGADTAENTETTETVDEQRTAPAEPAGSLRVSDRTSETARRGLAEEFRAAGFPGEVAEIPWQRYEERAITWTPSVNLLNQVDRQGSPWPVDRRYCWTALARDPVDSGVTSVQVLVQTGESAASGVVRPIDSTGDKAEVGITVDLATVPLSGVAGVSTGIRNIVLEQPAVNRLIENSLRNAVNAGLDEIVVATFAASDNEAPGANHVISIRKAITTLDAAGFSPDTVLLDPETAEELDLLVSGVSGADADFVFAPGQYAPDVFRLRRVVCKALSEPIVLDATAYGRLYASPARLAVFEENAGRTNTSTVRLELNAACGVERQDAAVRIAAS